MKHVDDTNKPPKPMNLAIAAFCSALGKHVRADVVTEGLPLQNGHLPTKLIPKAMEKLGFTSKLMQRDISRIPVENMPVLLVTKHNTGLVLTARNGDEYTVIIPETGGQKTFDHETLTQLTSGHVVYADLNLKSDDRARDFTPRYKHHWLREQLLKCWPTYTDVIVASVFANLLAVGTSLFALQVYDRVVPNDAFDTLLVLTIGVVIAILFDFLLRILRAYLLDKAGKKLDVELSGRLFSQVLFMRLKAKPQSTGVFANQLKEFESVREFFTSSTAATVSDFPFIFLFLLIIWYLGGPVVWVPIIAIIFMLLPSLMLQGKLAKLSREGLREASIKQGLMVEVIENLETVKASQAESRSLFLWDTITRKQATDNLTFKTLANRLTQGASMVQQLGFVFVVVVGVYQISDSQLTIGALIACTMLTSRTIAPVNQITGVLVRWQHIKVALEGLDQIMQSPVERPEGRQFAQKESLRGDYSLTNVQLNYSEDGPPALKIKSLSIVAGTRSILLGSNGAGKSTLLRVLAGIDDVDSGQVLIDDVAISQLDPADRQKNIGYLPQESALFYGTLRENLQLSDQRHSDDAIFEVLDNIGLGTAVREHPLGLDMPILSNRSLSGGQRQAVALARMILQDPKIVLLDEPTSAFDHGNEAKVIEFMQQWLNGKTVIMSTHKRNMVKLGTQGIVMKKGRVITQGTFDKILEQNRR